jgi:integrase
LRCGSRATEAAGAARAELRDGVWIVPAERVKNGRAHLVPLSPLAAETVAAAQSLAGDSPWLFPSPAVDDAPITGHALAVAMARFAEVASLASWRSDPPSPHDLRRTFATRLAALGVPKEDRDACLNHTRSDVGSKHYDLYDRMREKRRALEAWAEFCASLIKP